MSNSGKDLNFQQWLAGLIDGDGSFLLSKAGYASLEITMDIRDEHALQIVKNVYGGSIKLRSNAKALRYRLHHKSGLLNLINDVNGHIKNPNRLVQLDKICLKYGSSLIWPEKLTHSDNGWFSGLFDACGDLNIQLNPSVEPGLSCSPRRNQHSFAERLVDNKPQLVVSLIHKDYNLVNLYKDIFGGNLSIVSNGRYLWSVGSEENRDKVLNFLEYVKKHPMRSYRSKRFFLIPKFFNLIDLNAHASVDSPMLSKAWSIFNGKFNRPNIHTTTDRAINSYKFNCRYFHNTRIINSQSLVRENSLENLKLNPWFVTGFTDGEGSFSIIVAKRGTFKVQFQPRLFFQISLHVKDTILLEQVKIYFGVGNIYPKTSDTIIYAVRSIKDLTVIVNHFDKYPLITQKWADYYLWKQAFILIQNKEHMTLDGLNKIVALKGAMNLGLSSPRERAVQHVPFGTAQDKEFRTAFPLILPVQKPLVKDQVVPDPYWLAGFVSGEGCFYVEIYKSKASKLGVAVRLGFKLTQHSRDKELMKIFILYLDCGYTYNREASDYRVRNSSDIQKKIIPFFKNYPSPSHGGAVQHVPSVLRRIY